MWNDEFEVTDVFYSVSGYTEYIIKTDIVH